MKKYLIILLLAAVNIKAQTHKNPFTVLIGEAKGDLNKDGLPDLVRVTQDTVANTGPFHLEVFFRLQNGKYRLIASSDKLIAAQFPNGKTGLRPEIDFEQVTVNNNVLTINNQLSRGMLFHKFRYQHGNFELIGYTQKSSDGLGTMFLDDFNLSTGIRHYKEERYDTGEVTINRRDKRLIRPLPRLQDFVPFESDF